MKQLSRLQDELNVDELGKMYESDKLTDEFDKL